MTTVQLPDWPWRVVRRLAKHRGLKIWVVGGAVRDALLGRPIHDWDFAVVDGAMGLARAVGDALRGAYFPLDEERGTGRVVLTTDDEVRLELDFALLRGASLDADLAVRDFTINAMAMDDVGTLVDPLDGRADLRAKQIRATSGRAFRNDPVRLVRAVRVESELGFAIEPQTESWIRRDAALLGRPSKERVRDELARGMTIGDGAGFARRLDALRLLPRVIPELETLKGVMQSPPHRFDVWRHTLTVVETLETVVATVTGRPAPASLNGLAGAPTAARGQLARAMRQFAEDVRFHLAVDICDERNRALLLKLAALLHDIGKPETRSVDEDGRIHFYNHEPVGAGMAAARLRDLRFSRDEVTRVRTIIKGHLRPAHLARSEKITRRAIYRYFRDTGEAGIDVVLLGLADHLATWGPNLREERWMRRLEVAELLLSHYFERHEETIDPPALVNGHDLMEALGLPPGPVIGQLLETVREAQAAGEVTKREEALALAARISENAPD